MGCLGPPCLPRLALRGGRAGASRALPAVYIMASRRNGTLYTGVTADLPRRAHQHRAVVLLVHQIRDSV